MHIHEDYQEAMKAVATWRRFGGSVRNALRQNRQIELDWEKQEMRIYITKGAFKQYLMAPLDKRLCLK